MAKKRGKRKMKEKRNGKSRLRPPSIIPSFGSEQVYPIDGKTKYGRPAGKYVPLEGRPQKNHEVCGTEPSALRRKRFNWHDYVPDGVRDV